MSQHTCMAFTMIPFAEPGCTLTPLTSKSASHALKF